MDDRTVARIYRVLDTRSENLLESTDRVQEFMASGKDGGTVEPNQGRKTLQEAARHSGWHPLLFRSGIIWGLLMVLEAYPILTVGDPRLRLPSQPVTDIHDPELQRLIDILLETVQAADGVGIAAPQLGYPQRVLVLASRPNPRYPQAPWMDPLVVINPETLAVSDQLERGWEGCLSVPGQRGQVDRHHQVEVAYLDRQGQPQRQVWQGFVARVYQHEFDHLEGGLFIDRLDPEAEVLSESAYQARITAESSLG